MNSDVTVFFLDILPRLKKGVIVQIHDIFLPLDYPPAWAKKFYSEQYLLASYLLAEGNKFDILLANAFIMNDLELSQILSSLWDHPNVKKAKNRGGSFWIQMK